MIRVYSAKDIMEAHIVSGLLESRGIPAKVSGDYLQGGIGELPAMDLIVVWVNDEDVQAARKIIEEYDRGGGDELLA